MKRKYKKTERRLQNGCKDSLRNRTKDCGTTKHDNRTARQEDCGGGNTCCGNEADRRGIAAAGTARRMMDFLKARYALRYNTVTKCTEYRTRGQDGTFRPIDPRKRNRMAIEVRLGGIDASSKDVRDFLESDYIGCFSPISEFLDSCEGTWDGRDHIAALAHTVPTDTPRWERWFGTWFLAMVRQWREGAGQDYGNSTAPLLIAGQGFRKSTFCRRLLPPELAWGFTDSLAITEKRQVMQAMSQMLLINLDEFNQISPAVQQGFLKNIMQLPTVKMKRPYGTHMEEFPRTASFIATSNMTDILADPSGNRRFIGVELTAPIDTSRTPDYRQLYAQALQLLRNGRRCWFDEAETRAIMQWNRRYEIAEPAEQYFQIAFEPAEDEAEGEWLAPAEIFDALKRKAGSSLRVSSLMSFGRKLANMDELKRRHFMTGTKYLVKRI